MDLPTTEDLCTNEIAPQFQYPLAFHLDENGFRNAWRSFWTEISKQIKVVFLQIPVWLLRNYAVV